jgi:hypothetical protein
MVGPAIAGTVLPRGASMSAAKPSQLDLLDNVVPAIHRARRELAEARTRDEILEIRERAAAALEAAERIAGDAPTHGAISDALGHLMAAAAEIIDLADDKLEADSTRSPPGG